MKDNKYFLYLEDLFVNLLITLKEKGLDPKRLTYKEIVEYGEKLVEYGKKENLDIYLMLSRDKTISFYNCNRDWVTEREYNNAKCIELKKDYNKEELIKEHRGHIPLDVLLILLNENLEKEVVDKYINDHQFTINKSKALGNFIISKNGKCINERQFNEFLKDIKPICSIESDISTFEDFENMYSHLVKRKNNVIFPIKDMEIFEYYFRIGLPKELVEIFDKATSKVENNKQDIEEIQKAYLDYLDDFKKYELEREIITNSLEIPKEKIKRLNDNI